MKNKKKNIPNDINNLDNFSFQLATYIEGLFTEEYIVDRKDMDFTFKKHITDLLGNSYIQIYKLLRPRILKEDELDYIIGVLSDDVNFILTLLEDYPDICLELPLHYLTILLYIEFKIIELEKYEIAANLRAFFIKWEQKIRDNNWKIPI
jgi:hypothetical protein